jgi:hypothetical protein
VDINRNYDFLWVSGIGTSASSCSDVFKGSGAFSEPETRNVMWMLDRFPNIECMADVHSYSELILYPWGDDDSQTTDVNMNFQDPAFNGLRGTVGDTLYKEYIPQADLDQFVASGSRIRDAIAAVRGRVYTLEPGILLYPTSGTSIDYAYSRHFVDAGKRKVCAYTLETGTEFQPEPAEALNIIQEVSAGLIEFCRECICPSVSAAAELLGVDLSADAAIEHDFREKYLQQTRTGRYAVDLFMANEQYLLQRVRKTRLADYDRDFLRELYAKHIPDLRSALVDPEKSEFRLSEQHLNDAREAVARLKQHLSGDELDVLNELLELASEGVGKTIPEILGLLNDERFQQRTIKLIGRMPDLHQPAGDKSSS